MGRTDWWLFKTPPLPPNGGWVLLQRKPLPLTEVNRKLFNYYNGLRRIDSTKRVTIKFRSIKKAAVMKWNESVIYNVCI